MAVSERRFGANQHSDQVARATGDGVAAQGGKAALGAWYVHGVDARPDQGLRA